MISDQLMQSKIKMAGERKQDSNEVYDLHRIKKKKSIIAMEKDMKEYWIKPDDYKTGKKRPIKHGLEEVGGWADALVDPKLSNKANNRLQ